MEEETFLFLENCFVKSKMKPSLKEHTKKLFSARFVFIIRACALASLVGLLIFVFGLPDGGNVRAAPVFQDDPPGYGTPGYEGSIDTEAPTPTDVGYDGPVDATPVPDGSPFVNPTDIEPTIEQTPTETSTLPADVFRTEDAEMRNALTTPQVTETGGPTITPYQTLTVTKRPPRSTLTSTAAKKKNGFTPDWGLFWIGFSIPVLGACGVVLYLLDRRPDLFKHGK